MTSSHGFSEGHLFPHFDFPLLLLHVPAVAPAVVLTLSSLKFALPVRQTGCKLRCPVLSIRHSGLHTSTNPSPGRPESDVSCSGEASCMCFRHTANDRLPPELA